jgi:hypothetical protein
LSAADQAHQVRAADAGGTITSTLTDEGQDAAARIIAHTAAQLDAVHRPHQQQMDAAHGRLVEDARTTRETFAAKLGELRAFEDEQSSFLMKAKLPQRRRVTDGDLGLHLQAMLARAHRLVQPAPERAVPAPRPTLLRPDFSGILVRMFG